MPAQLPIPLNAVRAIEVVARRGALASAADELGVTVGAVSQHIRRAEERLGVELFERTRLGLRPTPALKSILPKLSAGFAQLAEAFSALRASDERVLTVTVGSVFASRWLVWRLAKFSALHKDVELRLVVTADIVELAHSDLDCAIRFGRGDWPGVTAQLIGGSRYRPVAAPEVARQLARPADLARLPVIRDTTSMLSWDAWWAAAGLEDPPAVSGPTFDSAPLAFDAAISGQGVLLAVDMMAADAVSDGRLVHPFEVTAESGVGYWLAMPEGRREPRKTRVFREWLAVEVPGSALGYVHQLAEHRH